MTSSIAQQKIRIRLKAFDRRMLDLSCDKIIQTADTTSASAIGPIPLPTKRKIYCVLRSPHVDKDSREHFETRTCEFQNAPLNLYRHEEILKHNKFFF